MIESNRQCLEQARRLVERLDDQQYRIRRGDQSSVGAQLRHVLDHYQCLLAGLPNGSIDYDRRLRDPEVEQSRDRALEVIDYLWSRLSTLGSFDLNRPIRVQLRCAVDSPDANWTESSLGRELQFLVSHSVHHFALLKLILIDQAVALDPEFGIAPSTLTHAKASQ